jgi:hypothetical protein
MIVHGMTDTAATGANNVVCELMDLIIIVGVQEVRAWKRLCHGWLGRTTGCARHKLENDEEG